MVFLDVVGLGNKEPLDDAPGYRYVDFDCEYHTSKHPLWELLFEKLGWLAKKGYRYCEYYMKIQVQGIIRTVPFMVTVPFKRHCCFVEWKNKVKN
jgi:hypothetical protein